MVGDSSFTFNVTPKIRASVYVSGAGVQFRTECGKPQKKREQTREMAFADVAGVTVFGWSTRNVKGEAIYLHPKYGQDMMFWAADNTKGRGPSKEDRESYDAAVAALFEALAVARPDIVVRLGRPPYFKLKAGFVVALIAGASSAAWLSYADGVSEVNRLGTVALIVAFYAVWGIYRLDLLKGVGVAGVRQIAAEMAARLPARGPWGALRAT